MYDVIVVGAGIAGLGVARAATERGLSVALFDAQRAASATSNNTLRIIHGGFRYLQSLDFARMARSLRDQRDLLAEQPNAVQILPCVMPLRRFGLKSALPVWGGAQLYSFALSAHGSPVPRPRVLSARATADLVPFLAGRAAYGGLEWHDVVMTDPSAIASRLCEEFRAKGGALFEERGIVEICRADSSHWIVRDSAGEEQSARAVVTALGPWADRLGTTSSGLPRHSGGWCKGFNLIVDRQFDPKYAVGIESKDGRLFFLVPRGRGTAIGTWYVPSSDQELPPTVSEEEIATFLSSLNVVLEDAAVGLEEVVGVDVGVLPMTRMGKHGPLLLGNERLLYGDGLLKIISTKYTTFRSQGEAVVRMLETSMRGR